MNRKYLYYTVFTISLIIALYSYTSISKVYEKSSALDNYKGKISALREENERLRKDLEYKKTDEFVINEARLKLNYGFENERTYLIPKNRKELNNESADQEENSEEAYKYSSDSGPLVDLTSNSGLPVYKLWIRTFF